jgi:large subunit ribosomal protein L15
MQLHEVLRASLSNRKRVRVGRGPGSGLGKTCGRGQEGATSRSGFSMKATYEGGQMPLFRRLPKRGFRNGPFRIVYAVVNVGDLGVFKPGTKVDHEQLRKAGLAKGAHGLPLKILGDGELKVALTVAADGFSKSAQEKIQKAGGTAEWVGGSPKKLAPDFSKLAKEKSRAAAVATAKAQMLEKPKAEKGAKPEKAPKPEKGGKPPAGPHPAKGQKPAEAKGEREKAKPKE